MASRSRINYWSFEEEASLFAWLDYCNQVGLNFKRTIETHMERENNIKRSYDSARGRVVTMELKYRMSAEDRSSNILNALRLGKRSWGDELKSEGSECLVFPPDGLLEEIRILVEKYKRDDYADFYTEDHLVQHENPKTPGKPKVSEDTPKKTPIAAAASMSKSQTSSGRSNQMSNKRNSDTKESSPQKRARSNEIVTFRKLSDQQHKAGASQNPGVPNEKHRTYDARALSAIAAQAKNKQVVRLTASNQKPAASIYPTNTDDEADANYGTDAGNETDPDYETDAGKEKNRTNKNSPTVTNYAAVQSNAHRSATIDAESEITKICAIYERDIQAKNEQIETFKRLKMGWEADMQAKYAQIETLERYKKDREAKETMDKISTEECQTTERSVLEKKIQEKNIHIHRLEQTINRNDDVTNSISQPRHLTSMAVNTAMEKIEYELKAMIQDIEASPQTRLSVPKILTGDLKQLVDSSFQTNPNTSSSRDSLEYIAVRHGSHMVLGLLALAALQSWVFLTEFPIIDKGSLTLIDSYRNIVFAQDGWSKLKDLEIAAYIDVMKKPRFNNNLRQTSSEFACRLSQALSHLYNKASSGHHNSFHTWGEDEDTWTDRQHHFKELFEAALKLKRDSVLTDDTYSFSFSFPLSNYDLTKSSGVLLRVSFSSFEPFPPLPGEERSGALVQTKNFLTSEPNGQICRKRKDVDLLRAVPLLAQDRTIVPTRQNAEQELPPGVKRSSERSRTGNQSKQSTKITPTSTPKPPLSSGADWNGSLEVLHNVGQRPVPQSSMQLENIVGLDDSRSIAGSEDITIPESPRDDSPGNGTSSLSFSSSFLSENSEHVNSNGNSSLIRPRENSHADETIEEGALEDNHLEARPREM